MHLCCMYKKGMLSVTTNVESIKMQVVLTAEPHDIQLHLHGPNGWSYV